MTERLDRFQERSVSPLVTMEDRLEWNEYDPMKQSESNFWSPFQEFNAVQFEHSLRAQFEELYPKKEDGESLWISFLSLDPQSGSMTIDGALSVVMGVLLLMSIGLVLWVNHKYAVHSHFERHSKLRRETAPLILTEN